MHRNPRAVANAAILVHTTLDDPGSLVWCAAILAIGVVMYVVNGLAMRREPQALDPTDLSG